MSFLPNQASRSATSIRPPRLHDIQWFRSKIESVVHTMDSMIHKVDIEVPTVSLAVRVLLSYVGVTMGYVGGVLTAELTNAGSVVSMQDSMSTLAQITTFLAAVQAQVNSYSFQQNDTALQVTTNIFFFVGLLLDVIAGCGAFMTARVMKRQSDLLLARSSSYKEVYEDLRDHPELHEILQRLAELLPALYQRSTPSGEILNIHVEFSKRLIQTQELNWKTKKAAQDFQIASQELFRTKTATRAAFIVSSILPTMAACGVGCLVLGVLCYTKYAQPTAVWISCFAGVGIALTFILLVPSAILRILSWT